MRRVSRDWFWGRTDCLIDARAGSHRPLQMRFPADAISTDIGRQEPALRPTTPPMPDQATILRDLIDRKPQGSRDESSRRPERARTIALASGKGGVGKSCLALNLAVALAQSGKRIAVLDACLGLGNIDLLCGLNGYWNLEHVITGSRSLEQIVLSGPAGIQIVPGASALSELVNCPPPLQQSLLLELRELERRNDFLIVDTSSGIHRSVRQFATAADLVLVTTVPETTAIADAYATVKALSLPNSPPLDIVINKADSPSQAKTIAARLQQTTRTFVRNELGVAGAVSFDPAVPQSVAAREPFVLRSPNCPAATDAHQLARRVVSSFGTRLSFESYFARFAAPSQRRAA
ncbi:P-loop NTPase [bacterium]|nr:P-loop NTPase [bacterium]